MSFVDPPEAPEGGGSMRAKDLLNKACLILPVTRGEWPASEEKKAQAYIECSVWVLDRAGVVEQGDGVRISWWKAVDQLGKEMGRLVGAKPVQHTDNSISLVALAGPARDVAERIAKEIDSGQAPSTGEEPF